MSTREQEDQKAPATWTFWDWMRMPIFPFRWLFSYFWRRGNTAAFPKQDAIQNEELQKQLGVREQEVNNPNNDCSQLRTRNEELQKQLGIREQDVNNLNSDCSRLQTRNEELQKQLGIREQEVNNLNSDCSRLQTRNEELQKQLGIREQEVNNLNSDCSRLRTRNKELQKHLSSREEEAIILKRDCSQLRTRNEELQKRLKRREEEVINLNRDCSQLRTRNEELQRNLSSREEDVITLHRDCSQLRTRLSQIAAMQLTEGNPNIADLSDQNRPDKLAEQFSELYDNQWTDCYQVLTDNLGKTEEDSIKILLKIVKTSYDICLDGSKNILTTTKDILFAFTGRSDKEPDQALDALIQEILHKLKSHRTKSFKAAPTNIEEEIRVQLLSMIGKPETDACDCFIEECIRTCWLMCIKDPPMYIFCDKEAVFDKNKYMEYTEMGNGVAYVVWPALYLHKDGPLMRKGVAQGEGKKYREHTRNANAANSQLPEPNHTQQYYTGIADKMKIKSDKQEKETQAHNSEETAIDDDSLRKTDVSSNEDKVNAEKQDYAYHTERESIDKNDKWNQKQKNEHFHALQEDESTEREEKANDKLTLSKEYCQERELSGGSSISRQESQVNERRNVNLACNSGRNGDEVSSSGLEPERNKNICESLQQEMLQLTDVLISSDNNSGKVYEDENFQSAPKENKTESKEHSNSFVSSDEYFQPRENLGAFNEDNQGKETQDGIIECNNGQVVKEATNNVHGSLTKNIGYFSNDAGKEENALLSNVRSYSNDNLEEEKEKNFQSSRKGEATQSKKQDDNKLFSSDGYCQERETLGAAIKHEEENEGKENHDGFIISDNGQEVKESINIILVSPAKNIDNSPNDAVKEEKPQSINLLSWSSDNWKEEKEKCSQSSIKNDALESKEQAGDKLVSSDALCPHRQTSEAGDINEEENQGKETQYEFIEFNNGQKVKEGIESMHVPLAINTGDCSKDTEEENVTQLNNIHSSSDNSWKEQKENNPQSSTKCDPTEIKEPDDNKLVSSDEYCQQRVPSRDSNITEDEHQVNKTQDGFRECNKGQDTKEGIITIPVSQARNIGDSTNDAEEKERTQSINVCCLSDDNWKEGKEKCSQSSTKDEEIKSKHQVDNKMFSYDDHSRQMETSGAFNITEEETLGKETNDGFLACTNGQEVKEAALIGRAPSDMNIHDSLNDVVPEERQKSTNVCSSSDYSCSDDKDEEDVQSSTKDDATESKEQEEHKLFLQKEYCQQMEYSGSGTINEENQGEKTHDWVIACNDGQEMNEAANVAHAPLEENTCNSSDDTEQERRLQLTDNSNSSDDNKKKYNENADFHTSP
ncbi:hypothetical protein CHS0354_026300 [Potamilus streckersoni]|uniref:Mitochondria-eating protein n=1 Tax=Potamilus streckersoni TaxID=2493646 RepID=A0AAE0TAX1_9BIVA|nr:hypothetical protein CHS0354_026300 [Potamilus streckersoni]